MSPGKVQEIGWVRSQGVEVFPAVTGYVNSQKDQDHRELHNSEDLKRLPA